MRTKTLGDIGEKIAEEYLKGKGYKILDINFRYKKLGEIDLVAEKGKEVIFFEVKTRMKKGISEFMPEDNITYQKQKKLIKLAQIWLAKRKLNEVDWQIDILAIEVYRDNTHDIRHLENAIGDFW